MAKVPRSHQVETCEVPLFAPGRRAPHSMQYAYSFVPEYARSAC